MIEATESPFACNISAFNPWQINRKRDLDKQVWNLVKQVRELPDGYAFLLPTDEVTFRTITEWVSLERLCCPFFSFTLELKREGGPLWLSLTGREGVKEFIRAEFRLDTEKALPREAENEPAF